MNKKELKKKLVEIIANERLVSNKGRIETICRSQLNRLSYKMTLGDHCIFIKNDKGKKIFIETKSGDEKDGWGRLAYVTAYNESEKILKELGAWYVEEVIHNNQQVS